MSTPNRLFFILFIYNLFSFTSFSEIINEQILENPVKEVTTISTKKNREHATLSITVNKINPISVIGKIDSGILSFPLNKEDNNSAQMYFGIAESINDIPNFSSTDGKKIVKALKTYISLNPQDVSIDNNILNLNLPNFENYKNKNLFVYKMDLQNGDVRKVYDVTLITDNRSIIYHDAGSVDVYVDSASSGRYILTGGDMGITDSWHGFNNPDRSRPLLYYKVDRLNIVGGNINVLNVNDKNPHSSYQWHGFTYNVYTNITSGDIWNESIMFKHISYSTQDELLKAIWTSFNTTSFTLKITTDSIDKPYQKFTINVRKHSRNLYNGSATTDLKDFPTNSWIGWRPGVNGSAPADFKQHNNIDRIPELIFTASNLFNPIGVNGKSIINRLNITKADGTNVVYDNIQHQFSTNGNKFTHIDNNYNISFTRDGNFYISKKTNNKYNENIRIQAEYLGRDIGSLNLILKNDNYVVINTPDQLDFGYMIFDPYNSYLEVEDTFEINNIDSSNLSFTLENDQAKMTLIGDTSGSLDKKIPLTSITLETLNKNIEKRVELVKIKARAEVSSNTKSGNYHGEVNLIINIQ